MGEELQQKIQAGLLKIIEKQRNGETIDVTVVKNVVTSLGGSPFLSPGGVGADSN